MRKHRSAHMHHHRLVRHCVSGDWAVCHLAGAIQQICDCLIEAVNVRAHLELHSIVHKCGLIGDVHRDGVLQVDVALVDTIKRANELSGVTVLRLREPQYYLGVLIRMLHAHAPVAEGAGSLFEQTLVGRVVLVDKETVREIEADAAKRVALAWRLENVY